MFKYYFRLCDCIFSEIFTFEQIESGYSGSGSLDQFCYEESTRAQNLIDIIARQRFTGIEANGVKLFEGDIFHLGDPNIKYVVEWLDCGLKGRQIGSKSTVGLEHWKDRIKIISNVFERAETSLLMS